jgi:hypothetical protein
LTNAIVNPSTGEGPVNREQEMTHTLKITAMSKSYYVSASCSCGSFSSFKNLPKSRGYKTDAVKRVKSEFQQHKLESK